MKIIKRIDDMRSIANIQRDLHNKIGLVPTMGALHEGHLTLIRRARQTCAFVVVSVFVNPTQFGPSEDFESYPRNFERDCELAEKEGVDVVFAPAIEEMYPNGFRTSVNPGKIGEILEGESRPGHFQGVATVVTKLFNIVCPDDAFFGLKDYQQYIVVRNLVQDLDLPVRIVPMPTIREESGLAMSSRNQYLSDEERLSATILHRTLQHVLQLYNSGERRAAALEMAMRDVLDKEPKIKVDYAVVRDKSTLEPIHSLKDGGVALLAVKLGSTRLIDNLLLGAV